MNNTENAFVDADLRPDIDRDKLLAQIAQGLLTAHARLDLMEERLVQATSRAVVEQLTSAVSTIKANRQISSAQLTELKGVLQVLANAEQNFSSAATEAIDKQVDIIHAAQNDSLSKLSAKLKILESIVSETAYKSNELLETHSHEHETNLAGIHRSLETQITDTKNMLKSEFTKIRNNSEKMESSMYANIYKSRQIANARFKQQVILIFVSCLCVWAPLGTHVTNFPAIVRLAVYIIAIVIILSITYVYYRQTDEELLKIIDHKQPDAEDSKSSEKQKEVI